MRALVCCALVLAGCARPVPPAPSAADPYPECAEIRHWLRDNTGEPDTVQIVAWTGRAEEPARTDYPAYVLVTVKYRARNRFGALQVFDRTFRFFQGRMEPQSGEP
jgi:hypothetical protein